MVQMQPRPAFISGAQDKKVASRAEVGAMVLYQDSLDGAAANRAWFAPSMSKLKIEIGFAQLALCEELGIHAGAFAHTNAH